MALRLGLSEETFNQVVACWQSEAKQLEIILLRWREKQEHTDDYAVLRKALQGLEPEGKNAFRADYKRKSLFGYKTGLTVNCHKPDQAELLGFMFTGNE